MKSIRKLLKSIHMPTHLTAIFKSRIAPEEGAALQGKKRRGNRGRGKERRKRTGEPWEPGEQAQKRRKLRLWLA